MSEFIPKFILWSKYYIFQTVTDASMPYFSSLDNTISYHDVQYLNTRAHKQKGKKYHCGL